MTATRAMGLLGFWITSLTGGAILAHRVPIYGLEAIGIGGIVILMGATVMRAWGLDED